MTRIEKGSSMHGESGYERVENDAYWTPEWCTKALLKKVALRGLIVEPAAGIGHIADVVRAAGYDVAEFDIVNRSNRPTLKIADFLKVDQLSLSREVSVVTNPPYVLAEEFVRHAIKLTKEREGMVAMLLRNEWDCAASRRDLFERPPFAKKLVLTKRPKWSAQDTASPRHNFSWFIWDWEYCYPHPVMEWGP